MCGYLGEVSAPPYSCSSKRTNYPDVVFLSWLDGKLSVATSPLNWVSDEHISEKLVLLPVLSHFNAVQILYDGNGRQY